jgi:organic radical activating enzyme
MSKKLKDSNLEVHTDGGIHGSHENKIAMRDLLNDKGPGFCLAKWTQVTMHLGQGLTHSCHHPVAHKIPLDELKENPSALHNTSFKKSIRKEMLNGGRPTECDFCWRIEDNTGEFSDRTLKSLDAYSVHDHDSIVSMSGDEDVIPKYVEVSFSNVCNLKCSYCGPSFSSKWIEEIATHGAYELTDNKYNGITNVQYKDSEDNPYTDAFWQWFPEASASMHTFRITGGEPLMSKHTFKVMEYLLANPNPNLDFAVNSNACVPDKLWKKFTALSKKLTDTDSVKNMTLFISAEATGDQCDYSRYGMNWNLFKENVEYFLDNTDNSRITFMSAFNVFSIPSFKKLLEHVLFLKQSYNVNGLVKWFEECGLDVSATHNSRKSPLHIGRPDKKVSRVGIDIPYVRHPEFLDANIITLALVQDYLFPAAEFMYANTTDSGWNDLMGFEPDESLKLRRILIDILKTIKDQTAPDNTTTNQSISAKRVDFVKFVNEYDIRRNLNFLETFPEMKEFYRICELECKKNETVNENQQ